MALGVLSEGCITVTYLPCLCGVRVPLKGPRILEECVSKSSFSQMTLLARLLHTSCSGPAGGGGGDWAGGVVMVGGLLGKRAGRSRLMFCGFSLSFPLCFSVFCDYIYIFKICSVSESIPAGRDIFK